MNLSTGYLYVIFQISKKINFPLKIDFRIKCHLETDMKKLFESKKRVTAIGAPDAKIIFTKASFIQYKQSSLDKNFRQYVETIMVSKKILMIVVQKIPIRKTYEILYQLALTQLILIFSDQIGNFIGLKYHWYLIKATNIQQFMIAIMQN